MRYNMMRPAWNATSSPLVGEGGGRGGWPHLRRYPSPQPLSHKGRGAFYRATAEDARSFVRKAAA